MKIEIPTNEHVIQDYQQGMNASETKIQATCANNQTTPYDQYQLHVVVREGQREAPASSYFFCSFLTFFDKTGTKPLP